jgi:Family of unknown function (DUF5362)
MEEVQHSSLFSLSIDPVTKAHLSETARWARFLAIVGLIGIVLLVVGGMAYSIWITSIMQTMQNKYSSFPSNGYSTGIAMGSAVMFVIAAAIAFFPMLYLLRFTGQMRTALNGNDQESLNSSFQNLKIYFRYIGIITIISLVLWIVWILVFAVAAIAVR